MRGVIAKAGTYLALGSVLLLAAPDRTEAADESARGEGIYETLCVSCHGRYGRGDGPLVGNLAVRPPDFTDPAWLGGRSEQQITDRLTGEGHLAMSLVGVLEPAALRDALAYVRTLSVPGGHVSLKAGRDIYQASCWVCHGQQGDGNGPATRNMQGTRPRDFTASDFVIEGREEEVREIVSKGAAAAIHGSSFMPEWSSQLSEQQIRDVVEYLKTFPAGGG
jgi:mono/diheme cytochrome c family protein